MQQTHVKAPVHYKRAAYAQLIHTIHILKHNATNYVKFAWNGIDLTRLSELAKALTPR